MDRKQMNELLGADESALDVIAQEYEEDTWDASKIGPARRGRPSLYDAPMR